MKVKRERPCQRRYHRVTAPLKVILPDGRSLPSTNWSLGGVRLDNVSERLPRKNTFVDLVLELPFQGFDISFEVKGQVVKSVRKEGVLTFQFPELSERAHDLMSHFIDDLVRGHMATVDDTICRIDVPVTPISTEPDPNPLVETPIQRMRLKTIVMSSVYLILAGLIFGYLFVLMYSNTMRMEVSSAVFSAPLTTVKMPMDGVLIPVSMKEHSQVKAGQVIARIQNKKFDRQLDEKRIELDQAKRSLTRMEERYRIEAGRMKLYQIINRTDRDIAKARVEAAKQALEAVDTQLGRYSLLQEKGLIETSRIEEAKTKQAEVQARLKEAQYDLERASAMDAVSERRYYNHKEFVSDLDLMALEVEEANALVIALSMQLEKLETSRESTVIKAPFDGRIVSVQQAGFVTVLRNEQLFTIEKSQQPTVTAFLDQDQILSVGMYDHAKVFVPALGRHLKGTVTRIDRNSAFLNSKASHYIWNDNKEKSATVSIVLDIVDGEKSSIHAGLPVVVVFSKRSTSDLYDNLKKGVANFTGAFSRENSI